HAFSIEWHGNVGLGIESNHSAIAMLLDELLHDHIIGRLLERDVQVPDALADVRCHDVAHEKFAGAGSRNRAALVIGISSRAKDRGVSHAPGHFHYGSARGSAGGQITDLIQGHYTDGSMLFGPRKSRSFLLLGCFGILVPLPFAFIEEKIGRDQFDSL